MNAGSVVGRPIPGLLADILGCYNLNVPNMLMAGLLTLTIWLTSRTYVSLMCYAAFYGVFSGALIALNPPCVARISRIDQIGMRVGLMFAMLSFPYVSCRCCSAVIRFSLPLMQVSRWWSDCGCNPHASTWIIRRPHHLRGCHNDDWR
jgi:hypothetical protein